MVTLFTPPPPNTAISTITAITTAIKATNVAFNKTTMITTSTA